MNLNRSNSPSSVHVAVWGKTGERWNPWKITPKLTGLRVKRYPPPPCGKPLKRTQPQKAPRLAIPVEIFCYIALSTHFLARFQKLSRIGRTGRAHQSVEAFTFAGQTDEQMIRDIEKLLGTRIERRWLPDFNYGSFVPESQFQNNHSKSPRKTQSYRK